MRLVIAFFIALFAIPIIQVAADRWIERAQSSVLDGSSHGLTIAAGKHHRSRDLEFTVPRFDWRPRARIIQSRQAAPRQERRALAPMVYARITED
jgi:hypothetical protein